MSLTVSNLNFSYGRRHILTDVSFTVSAGHLVSVLGPNGVGKSTLFKCMLGLLPRYTGEVRIEGKRVDDMQPKQLAKLVAYIPQSHYPAFNYTVFDMVLMGTSSHVSSFSSPGKTERDIAMAALEKLDIADFAGRDYMRISGGERQLTLIARALAQNCRVLVMDEPTANLDYGNQVRVLTRIRSLAEEGYAVILSTHHPEQAFIFSHDILAMLNGRIVAQGTPRDIMTSELIERLYGISVRMESLHGDRMRVCVPALDEKAD